MVYKNLRDTPINCNVWNLRFQFEQKLYKIIYETGK